MKFSGFGIYVSSRRDSSSAFSACFLSVNSDPAYFRTSHSLKALRGLAGLSSWSLKLEALDSTFSSSASHLCLYKMTHCNTHNLTSWFRMSKVWYHGIYFPWFLYPRKGPLRIAFPLSTAASESKGPVALQVSSCYPPHLCSPLLSSDGPETSVELKEGFMV